MQAPVSSTTTFPKIPKQYEGFTLQGKQKHAKDMKTVNEKVKELHRAVQWPESADDTALMRLGARQGRSVFAVSPEGKILGYAVAKATYEDYDNKGDDIQVSYISFIAVDPQLQHKHIGNALLLRLLEKIKKTGAVLVTVEFEDTKKLCDFYKHSSIPYALKLKQGVGYFCNNNRGEDVVRNRLMYDLTKNRSEAAQSTVL